MLLCQIVSGPNRRGNEGEQERKRERGGGRGRLVEMPAVATGGPPGLCGPPREILERNREKERGGEKWREGKVVGRLLDHGNPPYSAAVSKPIVDFIVNRIFFFKKKKIQ